MECCISNQVISSLVWVWWVIDFVRFEFESRTFWWFHYIYLVHVENHVCLSHGVHVICAAWQATKRIVAGVWDLMQRIGDGLTSRALGGRMIGRSSDAVYDLHRARGDEGCRFLGWASKPRSMVCQWFDLKTTGTISPGLTLKPVATVSLDLASKPVVSGFSV
jgi:hypothetical protein